MATVARRRFRAPLFHSFEILDGEGKLFGELRVYPSRLKWRDKLKSKYRSVSMETFKKWITENSEAAEHTR